MLKLVSVFISGIILKDYVANIAKSLITNGVNFYHNFHKDSEKTKNKLLEVYIVIKITNYDTFDEQFPVMENKQRVQPMWQYFENKNVIKIKIDNPVFVHETTSVTDFLNSTDLDIPFFKSFSEIYVYVHYTVDDKEYINVYTEENFINTFDFKVKEESELSKKYNSMICATINQNNKPIYITKYFKMYLNNNLPLTTEMLLLNYDNFDSSFNYNNINLQIVNTNIINTNSLKEFI